MIRARAVVGFLMLLVSFAETVNAGSEPLPMTASWYGPYHHGRKMANGETFNMYAISAAHKSLPFGTRLRLTHTYIVRHLRLDRVSGKRRWVDETITRSLIVRITDRGPYKPGRDLDLSFAAAQQLGMAERGVAGLRVQII